jgi:hypothetical protein
MRPGDRERLFCPKCGVQGAYDCTGEGDWVCSTHFDAGGCKGFISPLRERDLQGVELARLTLEVERLRAIVHQLLHVDAERCDSCGLPWTAPNNRCAGHARDTKE